MHVNMHSLHDSYVMMDVHALCLPIPLLQVSYTKAGKVHRKFCIPSTCKKLVKSIRYRRYPYVARTLLQQPQLKDATLAEIENVIHAECSDLCKLKPKPSELRYLPKAKGLVDFEWKNVESELSKKAPTLTLLLKAAARSKVASYPGPEKGPGIYCLRMRRHATFLWGIGNYSNLVRVS